MPHIAMMLRRLVHLEELDLDFNQISNVGLKMFVQATTSMDSGIPSATFRVLTPIDPVEPNNTTFLRAINYLRVEPDENEI